MYVSGFTIESIIEVIIVVGYTRGMDLYFEFLLTHCPYVSSDKWVVSKSTYRKVASINTDTRY